MGFWLNRTMCDVLAEMRQCTKTLNFSYLLGLIEEAQYMANRMEASLSDQKDYTQLVKQLSKLRKEKETLEEEE